MSKVSSGRSCLSLCPTEPVAFTRLFPDLLAYCSRGLGAELVLSHCLCTLYKRTPGSSRCGRRGIALTLPSYNFIWVVSKPLLAVLVQSAAVGFSCRWQTGASWSHSMAPEIYKLYPPYLWLTGFRFFFSLFLFKLHFAFRKNRCDLIGVQITKLGTSQLSSNSGLQTFLHLPGAYCKGKVE